MMNTFQYLVSRKSIRGVMAFGVLAAGITTEALAGPSFYSTSDPSHWTVSTQVGGADGQLASFSTSSFQKAVALSGRPEWIANNSSGTNGGLETWTFFVFRQTFDMTGYDASTAELKFQWAADDSGQGFASRGSWLPKYSLNGGALVTDSWPGGLTYNYGPTEIVNSGFFAGLNTIDFYVEGNGVTDGFALRNVDFTASPSTVTPVPEPETYAMMLAGLGLLGVVARRRKQQLAA